MGRQNGPAPATFLHESHGPGELSPGLDGKFFFSRLAAGRDLHRRGPGRAGQCGAFAAFLLDGLYITAADAPDPQRQAVLAQLLLVGIKVNGDLGGRLVPGCRGAFQKRTAG